MRYRFYNVHIDHPMSQQLGDGWNGSQLQSLHDLTDGAIYLHELSQHERTAPFAWKVVNAYFSRENSLMTYFRAYSLEGDYLPGATFGVHYQDMPHRMAPYLMRWYPKYGEEYYVPIENKFTTPNTGGYFVQVLSMDYPSEGLSFGMFKQGEQHQNLVVSFRLMSLSE